MYFDDFSNDELVEIFMQEMMKKGLHVRKGDENSFHAHLQMILARMSTERHFGNAGAVHNFFEEVFSNRANRLEREKDANKLEMCTADLQEQSVVARPITEILAEMDTKFVGLESVKNHIKSVANRIRVERLRSSRLGVPASSVSNHTCLVGHAGTGKKTMAGYIAEIFCSLGLVSHPKLRIYRGIDLKGSYVGQTKDKVNKMFDDCVDSVILIDEIYSLTPENLSNQDSFGLEAVDAIAGGLSDAKNATTIVLLSGQEEKLNRFLQSHPQLGAFFSQTIPFPDYTDTECLEMLKRRLAEGNYELPEKDMKQFDDNVLAQLAAIHEIPANNCNNAFIVNQIFGRMMDRRNARFGELLDQNADVTDDMLRMIDVSLDLPTVNEEEGR